MLGPWRLNRNPAIIRYALDRSPVYNKADTEIQKFKLTITPMGMLELDAGTRTTCKLCTEGPQNPGSTFCTNDSAIPATVFFFWIMFGSTLRYHFHLKVVIIIYVIFSPVKLQISLSHLPLFFLCWLSQASLFTQVSKYEDMTDKQRKIKEDRRWEHKRRDALIRKVTERRERERETGWIST